MAALRKRGTKYQVQIRRKGFAPVTRSFALKSDAEEWSRFMESKADRGDLPTPVKVLDKFKISDILLRYKREVTAKKKSRNTENYIIDAFLRNSIANLTLAQITTTHFTTYRDKRLKVVKAGTVNRELSIICHAFDMAEREWGMPIRENPIKKIKKLKVNNARTRRLSAEELAALEVSATKSRNPQIMPLTRLALATGMRRGEMLRLRWEHIDLDKRTLFIPVTKNGHARTIPLSPDAIAVFQSIEQGRKKNSKTVFKLSDNAARLTWERLVNRAGIKDLHFHDLRHEAISRFFEKGLSVPEVALISGHRDFRMLFRYTHLKAEDVATKLSG